MADDALEQKLRALELSSSDKYLKQKKILEFLKEHKLRDPRLVVKYGYDLIQNYRSKLGDEIWELYERVFIAALDSHQKGEVETNVAQTCLKALVTKFGKQSLRIKKLLALNYEAEGKYNEANSQLESILREDPVNVHAFKRKIALAKARGQNDDAITEIGRAVQQECRDRSRMPSSA
eukprot:TRINITY_DN33009_c0_g1_i4.p1 TRINITY_DN33009_c0_g1~~TRINITY_DN33009_c0_g1_i4.p1  ORF type:complete len:178 (-),score=28.89 TRINITY_DN33009_c0_g1_i4:11-544(-)